MFPVIVDAKGDCLVFHANCVLIWDRERASGTKCRCGKRSVSLQSYDVVSLGWIKTQLTFSKKNLYKLICHYALAMDYIIISLIIEYPSIGVHRAVTVVPITQFLFGYKNNYMIVTHFNKIFLQNNNTLFTSNLLLISFGMKNE